jgi:hypothetical protein
MSPRRKVLRALTRDGQDGPMEIGQALCGGLLAVAAEIAIILFVAVIMGVLP